MMNLERLERRNRKIHMEIFKSTENLVSYLNSETTSWKADMYAIYDQDDTVTITYIRYVSLSKRRIIFF
jgi:hypothetical protein